ncbi:hypothetical protein B4N89_09830 [Embleya scabrispora]|uniref:DUF4097 domain-containing protein n=1 Tax=Embleya scabrispora TaxID=159449 RepID=A0A1T3NWI2_9ACTN|nr:DUF4097 family beta strand repeat-containing protein [Embleya scabrispora]OPC81206.1 hypothetical protein B4N89_09830 [Embleya scabrispora]
MNRPLRTSLIFFGGLLTIGGILMAAWTGLALLSSHDVRDHRDFALSTGDLIIDTDDAGVTIEPGAAGTISVDSKITHSINGAKPSWSLVGNRLKLRLNCPGFMHVECDGSYRIKVPLGIPLEVSSDSGGISASGLRQNMRFSTDNGHIDVSESTGNLQLSTDNGGITTSRVRADTVVVDTDNGGVRLRLDTAPTRVKVTTDNGGVRVTVPGDENTYRVSAKSGNGGIDNELGDDPRANRSIEIRTDNGGITVDRAPAR